MHSLLKALIYFIFERLTAHLVVIVFLLSSLTTFGMCPVKRFFFFLSFVCFLFHLQHSLSNMSAEYHVHSTKGHARVRANSPQLGSSNSEKKENLASTRQRRRTSLTADFAGAMKWQ